MPVAAHTGFGGKVKFLIYSGILIITSVVLFLKAKRSQMRAYDKWIYLDAPEKSEQFLMSENSPLSVAGYIIASVLLAVGLIFSGIGIYAI